MLLALTVIGVVAFTAWNRIAQQRNQPNRPGSAEAALAPGVEIGGPFELVDHRGRRVSDADFRGRFMLVFFGYASCPDVCPTELATIARTMDALGAKAEAVQPLFITVDPARDTVEFLADYVTAIHPKLIGLTGDEEAIARVARAYRVYYRKAEGGAGDDYPMDRSSFVYLMGPDGRFVAMFRAGTDPGAMAAAIAARIDAAGTGRRP